MWAVVEPLLPPERSRPKGGRPRASDRAALAGILFVLRTGIQWHGLPLELGCCGKTCWRRSGERHAAGVRTGLHRVLPERLHDAGALDWHRAALDGVSLPVKSQPAREGVRGRAEPDGPRRPGTKRHVVTDAQGTPRGVTLSAAEHNDSMMLAATLDAGPGSGPDTVDDRGNVPTNSTPAGATTTAGAAASAAPAASSPTSRDVALRAARSWEGPTKWSSAASPG